MINVNDLKNKGISDNEIQSILSIKAYNFTIMELVNPHIFNDEIVIGYDGIYPFIVKADGVFIHEKCRYRFVNSNTIAFLNCLAKFVEYCNNIVLYEHDDENTILEIVKNHIKQIEMCDPKALSNEDFYWSVITQQMIDGNL